MNSAVALLALGALVALEYGLMATFNYFLTKSSVWLSQHQMRPQSPLFVHVPRAASYGLWGCLVALEIARWRNVPVPVLVFLIGVALQVVMLGILMLLWFFWNRSALRNSLASTSTEP